jgi:hypothetical protein
MNQKIMLPAVSVGLLVSGREAVAGVVDFGVVAESLIIGATFAGNTVGNTIGGYTLNGLTFVGSHLNDVINGNTVTNILSNLLGQQGVTLAFNLLDNTGAAGNFTLSGAGLALNNNTVSLAQNTIGATLTSCTSLIPGTLSSGCTPGTQVQTNPYDPTGFLATIEAAKILTISGVTFTNGPLTGVDQLNTIILGSVGNTIYQGEEILTTDSISAAAVPEPAGWSLAALGSALVAWWRRRR